MILQAKSYLQFICSKKPHNAAYLHVYIESYHSNSDVTSHGVACGASYIGSQGSKVPSRVLQWVAPGTLAATPVSGNEALCTKSVGRPSVQNASSNKKADEA